MKKNYLIYIAFLMLLSVTACNLDPFSEQEPSSFDKLYALSENVEAVDFICKPDASGYIVVGNSKSLDNSDIIIINVGSDGMQQNLHRISTPFYDEAVSVKLYQEDNSVLILAHRRVDPSEPEIERNLIVKSNLDGVPVGAEGNDSSEEISADFKILTINENPSIYLNDFLIENQRLIAIGNIHQDGNNNRRKITQIYDFNSVDFNNRNDSVFEKVREKLGSNFNSSNLNIKISPGNSPASVYEIIGQNMSENPNTETDNTSLNISWEIFTDLESNASERIYVGSDQDEEYGDILYHSNGKYYVGGNYLQTDSIFLIAKEYNGSNNNSGQSIFTLVDYGNRVTSLTEDENEHIIMATVDEGTLNSSSYILKFSQSGTPIEDEDFEFISTGFYNIQKIQSEPGNILVILSQKTFENNSTAIGLMKIKF
ncbi:hypothetical protein [Marivirga harenae]|uniref:hypothetical protein n=1 Tax=Marivirga harenae TaxID=2010992 RepID=UPI0026DF647E|nr:hypothetical protein [Marivirga harenae]WKV11765.1 hypothetical protein Q3Y49_16305 [Marivirga harenae]